MNAPVVCGQPSHLSKPLARLKTTCTPETGAALSALARENGMTKAALLRRIVERFVASAGKAAGQEITDSRGGRGGRVQVRLTQPEVARIRKLAEPAGQSAPGWIVALIRQHLGHAVPFSKDELREIRNLTRELSAVGTNLNMIAHRLMQTGRYAEAWEPQRLARVLGEINKAIRDMVNRAKCRMGATGADAE